VGLDLQSSATPPSLPFTLNFIKWRKMIASNNYLITKVLLISSELEKPISASSYYHFELNKFIKLIKETPMIKVLIFYLILN